MNFDRISLSASRSKPFQKSSSRFCRKRVWRKSLGQAWSESHEKTWNVSDPSKIFTQPLLVKVFITFCGNCSQKAGAFHKYSQTCLQRPPPGPINMVVVDRSFEVIYKPDARMRTTIWWSFWTGGSLLRFDCIMTYFVKHSNFFEALP